MATNDFPLVKSPFYEGEEPKNAEQQCPLALVLDTSYSMEGGPLLELQDGLNKFQSEIRNDEVAIERLEPCIITFDSDIKVVQDFSHLDDFTMPVLKANGSTKLVEGVREGINRISQRKLWYTSQDLNYYRPYILLLTDGEPDHDQDVDGLASDIRKGVNNRNFRFWAFGVNNANMDILRKISHPEFPPLKLKDHSFVRFFEWLSKSFGSTGITGSTDGNGIDLTPDEHNNPFQFTL